MNPVLAAELHRLDHLERLREAENHRLCRQLASKRRQPSLAHLWHKLSHLVRPQRALELAK